MPATAQTKRAPKTAPKTQKAQKQKRQQERTAVIPQTPAQLVTLLATPITLGSSILPPEAQVLTVPEVTKLLRIGKTMAYHLVLRGDIPSLKIGQLRRVPLV